MAKNKRSLEDFLKENVAKCRYEFKSRGERKIAGFLEENDINYKYESGVLIYQTDNLPRIWYPYVEFHIM